MVEYTATELRQEEAQQFLKTQPRVIKTSIKTSDWFLSSPHPATSIANKLIHAGLLRGSSARVCVSSPVWSCVFIIEWQTSFRSVCGYALTTSAGPQHRDREEAPFHLTRQCHMLRNIGRHEINLVQTRVVDTSWILLDRQAPQSGNGKSRSLLLSIPASRKN